MKNFYLVRILKIGDFYVKLSKLYTKLALFDEKRVWRIHARLSNTIF
jgi:hypothetical protein